MTAPRRVMHVATTDMTVRFLLLPQLERLRDDGWDVAAVSAAGPWVEDIRRRGIRHVGWPSATRSWSPSADVRAARELFGILRRERPDVVHCHTPKAGVIGRVVGRAARVPVVMNTVHGYYATPDDAAIRRLPVLVAESLAARCSRLELFQGREDLDWARRIGLVVDGRFHLLGNGIDVSRFGPGDGAARIRLREELGIPSDALVVGTVGRLSREKGIEEVRRAAERVLSARDDVWFLAVGAPEEPDALRPPPRFVVTGWRTDVPELLGAMDLFVLASWREGVPRSAFEAAATGLPMILTDVRGCREVGADGAAVFVPARDAERLERAILDLVNDDGARRRLGAAARRRALERFDERRVLDIVSEVTGALSPDAMRDGVRVRRASDADVVAIASLHGTSMPDAMLPRLGVGALRRYHRALVRDREATVVVAEAGDAVVGFAAGVPSTRRLARRILMRHGLGFGLDLGLGLARPGGVRRARESLRYGFGVPVGVPPSGEVLAVAVAKDWRGRGVGLTLTATVLRALRAGGCERVRVLVGDTNRPAVSLYRDLGFRPSRRLEVHRGVRSMVMVA